MTPKVTQMCTFHKKTLFLSIQNAHGDFPTPGDALQTSSSLMSLHFSIYTKLNANVKFNVFQWISSTWDLDCKSTWSKSLYFTEKLSIFVNISSSMATFAVPSTLLINPSFRVRGPIVSRFPPRNYLVNKCDSAVYTW